jgi:hypothetical protein
MTGATVAANVSAPAVRIALTVARASARRGLPRACPRALAAARAAFVRAEMIRRSRSAHNLSRGILMNQPWRCGGLKAIVDIVLHNR